MVENPEKINIEIVEDGAASAGFKLIDDLSMPANNQLLVLVTDDDST